MIHIVSEVVVVVALTFYFNQKNKKLMAHIEDLAQRVEEQEDLLQKHEQIIKQLVDHISKQQTVIQQKVAQPPVRTRKVRAKRRVSSPLTKPPEPPRKVHFAPTAESESESESETDLDNELKEELNDLVNNDDNLKKE